MYCCTRERLSGRRRKCISTLATLSQENMMLRVGTCKVERVGDRSYNRAGDIRTLRAKNATCIAWCTKPTTIQSSNQTTRANPRAKQRNQLAGREG